MTTEAILDPLERFQEFFKSVKYRNLLKQMAVDEKRSITIDFIDLSVFNDKLALVLMRNPDNYIVHAEKAILSQLRIEAPEYAETLERVHVRFRGLPQKVSLRTIGADHIEQLISFDGIVVRATPVRPLLIKGVFKCKCGAIISVPQTGFFVRPPLRCENPQCRREGGFELVIEKSEFLNSQELRIQERPEDLPPGQLPRAVEVFALDDIVDIARPGDRLTITGIIRARPEIIPGKGRLRLFQMFIDANYIETVGKEIEAIEISPEDEKKIKEIAKREFVHKDIVSSIAPSIYGYEEVKEAIMYLLFGGIPKTTFEGVTIRGDVHVLLVGDPGTAKSQLLQYVARVSPRGLYTSGRGTTAAGLTAAVIRERAGGMALEAGALVLSDKGIACIDEIDKMKDEDRVAIHEAMEQQTVSVAKGGIIATLNARASILAAANPKFGRYEDRLPVAENINIPIVILSRFDLIFIEKDRPVKETDERLSEHILIVHRTGGSAAKSPIAPDLLRKYISYARSRVQPKLTDEASKRLRDFYLKMREQSGREEGSPVAITPRQLEALVRIAEARAKAALRDKITAMDAEAAIKIVQKSLQDVGAMREEEVVDIDVIMTGKPISLREGLASVLKLVGEMERETGEVEVDALYRRLESEYKISMRAAEDYIRRLEKDGTLYSPRPGYLKKA